MQESSHRDVKLGFTKHFESDAYDTDELTVHGSGCIRDILVPHPSGGGAVQRLSRSKCKSLIFYEHISGMLLGNAFRRGGHSAILPICPVVPRQSLTGAGSAGMTAYVNRILPQGWAMS